eukprot:scaffold39307_cov69-Phaeocystis_antarctica.AAC.6
MQPQPQPYQVRPINLREYVAEQVSESFEDDFVSLNQSQRTEVDAARHAFSEDMMLVFKSVADSARTQAQGFSLPSRILDGSFAGPGAAAERHRAQRTWQAN